MQRPDSSLFVMSATRGLAVNGHDFSFSRGGHGLDPSNEAFLKRGWFERRKDSRESVMRWNAVFQFQKGFEPGFFPDSELFHLGEVFSSTNRCQDGNRNDVNQRVFLATVDSWLR